MQRSSAVAAAVALAGSPSKLRKIHCVRKGKCTLYILVVQERKMFLVAQLPSYCSPSQLDDHCEVHRDYTMRVK